LIVRGIFQSPAPTTSSSSGADFFFSLSLAAASLAHEAVNALWKEWNRKNLQEGQMQLHAVDLSSTVVLRNDLVCPANSIVS
jgi:hypothetical protein